MPLPPMWERHVPGEYPAGPPRPRPEDDPRPFVLPPEPPRLPEGPVSGEGPGPRSGWRG